MDETIELEELEDVRCPLCDGSKFVKNGLVRGVQRYRCNPCKTNFSTEFKKRWPPSSKLITLLLLQSGESMEELRAGGASPQTIDRWLSEAKEHHPWFVRALAEHGVWGCEQQGVSIQKMLSGLIGMYEFITKHQPEHMFKDFGDKLLVQMIAISDASPQDALIDFFQALEAERGSIELDS
jgi:hypothetical protein